jgi:putative membrane protein
MSTCQHLIKSITLSFVCLITLLSFVSCGGNQVDPGAVSVAQIKPAIDTKAGDTKFLVTAAELSLEEVLLGKLAQTRAALDEVKQLGKMLEDANRERKSSIASIGIMESIKVPSVPSASAHATYDQLNLEPVENFDYAYVKLVIQKHNDAISLYESATQGNIDPDIKAKATAMLTDLRSHLAKAMEIDAKLNPTAELIQ